MGRLGRCIKEGDGGRGVHNLVGGGKAFVEKGALEEEQVCRVKSPFRHLRCLWDVRSKGR